MGREFVDLFNEWSDSYDQTVDGQDIEYKKVFENYHEILKNVADNVKGNILEFGVGTGNLTNVLMEQGKHVKGIEPSPKMREKALSKLKGVKVLDGDFIQFPLDENEHIDAFVSSYAFHHLTDEEKEKAIAIYADLLSTDGKIVFADTIFRDEEAKNAMIEKAKENRFFHLAHDLQTEFYTTIPVLTSILEKYGFTVEFTNMNEFVWIMNAKKDN
jgi:putative AdoMet-dependent methyltransferase